jgi:RNA polymerase sigma-70 factor (sigma-E family)
VKGSRQREDEQVGTQAEVSFLGWLATNREGLRKTAYLLCGDWHLADDLVQEALTRLFGVWGRISGSGSPGPYARKILVNLYLDHRRRPSRREIPLAQLPETPDVGPANGVDGDRERLMRALRQVPNGQRAVLVLRYWEDLSIEQTAQILRTSTSNVRSQSSRGLEHLRAALEPDSITVPKETL